jgi:hypothetical protein
VTYWGLKTKIKIKGIDSYGEVSFHFNMGVDENVQNIKETIMEEKNPNPINEARRYVANAKENIEKANYDPELGSYVDCKYVKTAGNILWSGCLVALDAVLHVRKGKGRPSIEKYKKAAGQRDGKLLYFINLGYDMMHLVMGYDGNTDKKVCDIGFDYANSIIDRCAILLPGTVSAPTLAAV